jgi:spore maturation protein CgeB
VNGCGGFYLGGYVTDIESFAVDGRHCAWYRTPAEAAELARHYLAHPAERRRIAEAGRAHALRHHTYAQRVELLLSDREYRLEHVASDQSVVSELEHPDAGQPLDRA